MFEVIVIICSCCGFFGFVGLGSALFLIIANKLLLMLIGEFRGTIWCKVGSFVIVTISSELFNAFGYFIMLQQQISF